MRNGGIKGGLDARRQAAKLAILLVGCQLFRAGEGSALQGPTNFSWSLIFVSRATKAGSPLAGCSRLLWRLPDGTTPSTILPMFRMLI